MNILECIDEYVKAVHPGMPIFTDDMYAYVAQRIPGVQRGVVNTNIARYAKINKDFARYQKGIYYVAVNTPFGRSGIRYSELLKRKYLVDGDRVIGYETGPSYMNKMGLTTQMPADTFLATDRTKGAEESGIVIVKPVTQINNENYRYLQFLDMLDNRMKVKIEADNYRDILRGYIDAHSLNFERLMYYARYYKNNRIYSGIAELAREA